MSGGVFGGFLAVLGREWKLALRHPADTLAAVLFFVLVAALFPFGVGPAPDTLARLAPGALLAAALLAALQEQDGAAWHPAGEPRPPGSLAAELCLQLSYRARDSSAGLDLGELRVAAEAVADAASEAGLRVPSVATIWGRDGEE